MVTSKTHDAIGVDLNPDHLAVSETDASGNWLRSWPVSLVTFGKNTKQAMARIGDAVAIVVQYAREAGKPIVIERLDFGPKRALLKGGLPGIAGCCPVSATARQEPTSCPGGLVRKYRGTDVQLDKGTPSKPCIQLGHWPGEIHGALRSPRPPGCGPSHGPSFARLFGRHTWPTGCSRWQRGPCRLHHAGKAAGEARMDPEGGAFWGR